MSDAPPAWRTAWESAEPMLWTPGAAYLAERGIPIDLATEANVRYLADFLGRPSVLFPVSDQTGVVVAVIGRYIDGRGNPKGRAYGPKSLGVFATPGALTADRIVIAEAPIDALSLAVVGVPSIAVGGTSWTGWLPAAAALRKVAIGFDFDGPGEEWAKRLATQLQAVGCDLERWRPVGKDWNEMLLSLGAEAMRQQLGVDSRPAGWSERLGREVYEPVLGRPGCWQETAESAGLCIWCSERLAEGELLSCSDHRL